MNCSNWSMFQLNMSKRKCMPQYSLYCEPIYMLGLQMPNRIWSELITKGGLSVIFKAGVKIRWELTFHCEVIFKKLYKSQTLVMFNQRRCSKVFITCVRTFVVHQGRMDSYFLRLATLFPQLKTTSDFYTIFSILGQSRPFLLWYSLI